MIPKSFSSNLTAISGSISRKNNIINLSGIFFISILFLLIPLVYKNNAYIPIWISFLNSALFEFQKLYLKVGQFGEKMVKRYITMYSFLKRFLNQL